MSYTPSPTFDFSSSSLSYTPPADFDFTATGGLTVDLVMSQQYDLLVYTELSQTCSQSWVLGAAVFSDVSADQAYDLSAPAFADLVPSQQWALEIPTFTGPVHSFGYALTVPAFSDVTAECRWAQIPPHFEERVFEQAYELTGCQPLQVSFHQRYGLEALAVWQKVISATAYLMALELGEDSTQIPISSLSCSLRSAQPSYLQCSIPDAASWADVIATYAADEASEIVISAGHRWSDGSYTVEEIARVTLRNVTQYYGAKSASVNLDGTDTRTNSAPKSVTLTGSSYRSIGSNGLLRYRCTPDFSVQPGDTATIDGDTITVGEISWNVAANNVTMEIAESA